MLGLESIKDEAGSLIQEAPLPVWANFRQREPCFGLGESEGRGLQPAPKPRRRTGCTEDKLHMDPARELGAVAHHEVVVVLAVGNIVELLCRLFKCTPS